MARPTRGLYLTKGRANELEQEIRAVERRLDARVRSAEERADAAARRADGYFELLQRVLSRRSTTATKGT